MPVRHVCFKLSLIVVFIPATASWLCAASMGRFVATGDMTIPRALHGAALLPDGKVLLAGGVSNYQYQSSAETYDPSTGTFTATGSMAEARQFCGLTNAPISLQNGKVLVTGGVNSGGVLSSAELYDETTGTFSTTGSMFIGRWCPTVTLLKDGKVLVAGAPGSSSAA